MDISIVLSLFSLVVAICSFIYSAYNIERDKAKVKAWADVVSHSNYDTEQTTFNVLKLTVANIGRRPIIIKGFKVQADAMEFSIPAKDPNINLTIDLNDENARQKLLELRHIFSTENTCALLKEGEFFEREIAVEDSRNDLITNINDEWYEGNLVYVQDIQEREYKVDNCEEKISLFYKKT